jgi:iron-sulfur cluster assembly accessory protein
MNIDIKFTDAASDYIGKMVAKSQGIGFRLSVKKTGCSGYSYLPAVIDTVNPADAVFQLPNGVMIYVDTAWLAMLSGVQVDYIEEEKSGLKQKRLVFTNPKESSRCGCGESFHIE